MATKIFVNLPVKDLAKSMTFFKALGFSFNPQFTDETAACMVISDSIYAMLLTHAKFGEFTSKRIAGASQTKEVLNALSRDSRSEVDVLVDAAVKAGGVEPRPSKDYGFMYYRSFDDLDGHTWEIMHMDESAIQKN